MSAHGLGSCGAVNEIMGELVAPVVSPGEWRGSVGHDLTVIALLMLPSVVLTHLKLHAGGLPPGAGAGAMASDDPV